MRKRETLLCLFCVVLSVCLVSGCAKKKEVILAKVGEKVITLSQLHERINELPPYYQPIVKKNLRKFLDDLITEELLYKRAKLDNLTEDPEVKKILQQAEKKIIVSKLLQEEIEKKTDIKDEEIKEYYESHKDDFMTPMQWRASHILVSTKEEAEDILKNLKEGADFAELAKEKSKDTSKERGGDIGYFVIGQLVPEFEEACTKLQVDQISEPVQTQFGFHIIKLTDKREPKLEDFEKVKSWIGQEIAKNDKKKLFDVLVAQLKKESKITIDEDLLKKEEEAAAKEAEPKPETQINPPPETE